MTAKTLSKTMPKGAPRGVVVVWLVMLLALMAATASWMHFLGETDVALAQQKTTQTALATAKEALLAYAVRYGRLPCPADVRTATLPPSNEGVFETVSCGTRGVSVIGLFPWKGLGLPLLKDDSDTCLWYAVAGHMKNPANSNVKSYPINADTQGAFQVVDTAGALLVGKAGDATENAVAIIIAPHAPTTTGGMTQNRGAPDASLRKHCRLPVDASNTNAAIAKRYMDSATLQVAGAWMNYDNWNLPATAIDPTGVATVKTFIQGSNNGKYLVTGLNDQLAWITADEWSKASTQYAANALAGVLDRFYADPTKAYYPSAAALANGACTAALDQGFFPASCPYAAGAGFGLDATNSAGVTLKSLLDTTAGDNWGGKISYQVSPKCFLPTAPQCTGHGGFLSFHNKTNVHTLVKVQGRRGFEAVAYTR